ncbi:MAG: hypothetical protein OEN22_05875 [Gammaproteobacteria bacterium]|nr:hypothetical protein [Gammaproteobacteria bacterium]
MDFHGTDWQEWYRFFLGRSQRPLPALNTDTDYTEVPKSLAKSLAIFQLGESGGGTVIEQARCSRLPGIDADYASSMALFVREENRHANILAMCVRLLGGELIHENWTARLFVSSRRLMGLRLKVLVLLAAEVVGICYYHLLASRLPPCEIRDWLSELVDDEQSHLYFHCAFLRRQSSSALRRWIFVAAWRSTMLAAAVVVMIDHRRALRDMGIPFRAVWCRWMSCSRKAERLVIQASQTRLPAQQTSH